MGLERLTVDMASQPLSSILAPAEIGFALARQAISFLDLVIAASAMIQMDQMVFVISHSKDAFSTAFTMTPSKLLLNHLDLVSFLLNQYQSIHLRTQAGKEKASSPSTSPVLLALRYIV